MVKMIKKREMMSIMIGVINKRKINKNKKRILYKNK